MKSIKLSTLFYAVLFFSVVIAAAFLFVSFIPSLYRTY